MSRSAVGDPDTHLASKSALWLRPLASHLYRSALCDPVSVRSLSLSRVRMVPALCVSVLLRAWQAPAHRLSSWVVVRLRSRLLCILGMALAVCGGRPWWHRTAVVDGHDGGDVEIRDWDGDGTALSGVGRRVRAAAIDAINTVPRGRSFLQRSEGPRGGVRPEDRVCKLRPPFFFGKHFY